MLSRANSYSYTGPTQPKKQHHYLALIILLVWLVLLSLAALNRQNIIDWWRLRGYHPPQSILNLAHEDTMTPYALKVYEVNHPVIEAKASFNTNCPNDGGEKTIVLGCYHSDQAGIFLLNVSDPRLDGVEQVTAAHEMLHAAYERLSSDERNKVDAMLINYYKHDLHDARIISTINAYKKSEPNAVVNEMHSVFGTEVMNLPAPLEAYYKRYFTNRQTVATYANNYDSEFTTRQSQAKQFTAELAQMKPQILSLEATAKQDYSSITSTENQLDTDKSNGQLDIYNAAVPGFNQQVANYNSEEANLKNLITNYNSLVDQLNSVVLTENQLYNALSGS